MRTKTENCPLVANDLCGDCSSHCLEQLRIDPITNGVVIGDVDRAGHVQNEFLGIENLQRVLAEHSKRHDETGLWILDIVNASTKRFTGVFTGANEVELGSVRVRVGCPIDERTDERQFVGFDGLAPWPESADNGTLRDKQRHFVGIDDDS